MGEHTAEHYVHVAGEERVNVLWTSLNTTELVQLALRAHKDARRGMQAWYLAHHGQRRQVLIDIICGHLGDAGELTPNPVHRIREAVHQLLRRHWRLIKTQIRCDAVCANCPDIRPLACYLDNEYLLRREDRGALDQPTKKEGAKT